MSRDHIEWLITALLIEAVREQMLNRELVPFHPNVELREAALAFWMEAHRIRYKCVPTGWVIEDARYKDALAPTVIRVGNLMIPISNLTWKVVRA